MLGDLGLLENWPTLAMNLRAGSGALNPQSAP